MRVVDAPQSVCVVGRLVVVAQKGAKLKIELAS